MTPLHSRRSQLVVHSQADPYSHRTTESRPVKIVELRIAGFQSFGPESTRISKNESTDASSPRPIMILCSFAQTVNRSTISRFNALSRTGSMEP